MAEHNHMTRDIKPLWGGCRGCDEYHVNALQMRVAELRDQIDAARAEVAALAEKLAKCTDDKVAERVAFGKERNALKAEVAALREQMSHMYQAETFTDTDGYPSTRVFKAEVVGENEWAAHIRREVLADLKAKVRDLPVPPHVNAATGATVSVDRILALIDEAQP